MPRFKPKPEKLRLQIETAQSKRYPTITIENRIAEALLDNGLFDDLIGEKDLAIILRHVVYGMFARQKVAGLSTGIVHNIPTLNVSINESEAHVDFVVHIHRPIVAFIEFEYVLVNDPVAVEETLRLKRNSLVVKNHTRRLDLKAKAALAAVDIESMAKRELDNINEIVATTLPSRLQVHGVEGTVECVSLQLANHQLRVCLVGDCRPSKNGSAPATG